MICPTHGFVFEPYCYACHERADRFAMYARLETMARNLAAAALCAEADAHGWMSTHGARLRERAARIAFEGFVS